MHRVAKAFGKWLGKAFKARSPNGRFADGAKAIDGKKYRKIEAVGKNLFAFFEGGHVVHIHFGMSGRWSIFKKGRAPDVKPTTRLVLEGHGLESHLSAMTCTYGDESLYHQKRGKLGEDPLDPKADVDALWTRVSKSRKPISRLLMDQSFFAGVGNIFRAEILFVARIHPGVLGNEMTRDVFDRVWAASVKLMRVGYESGRIVSLSEKEAKALGAPHRRRFVYNQSTCLMCDKRVSSFDEASRTVWACLTCQRKDTNVDEDDARVRRERAAFASRCAPEPMSEKAKTPMKLTVRELRSILTRYGFDLSSQKNRRLLKSDLVSMFANHRNDLMEHTADLDLSVGPSCRSRQEHGYHRRLLSAQEGGGNAQKEKKKSRGKKRVASQKTTSRKRARRRVTVTTTKPTKRAKASTRRRRAKPPATRAPLRRSARLRR